LFFDLRLILSALSHLIFLATFSLIKQ